MRAARSRADLLKVLSATSASGDTLAALADRLGFDYRPSPPQPDQGPDKAPISLSSQEVLPEVPLIRRASAQYWYVASCTDLFAAPQDADPEAQASAMQSPGIDDQPPPAENLPHDPLWSDGAWQNCWDQALPSRREKRALDIRRAVAILSRGRPVARLPRQSGKSFNRPCIVLMERSRDLYPLWHDLDIGWRSLDKLLGAERLHTYIVDQGPDNDWRHLATGQRHHLDHLEPDLPVVMLGAFGALHSGRPAPAWYPLMQRLLDRGHPLLLIPCNPLQLPELQSGQGKIVPLDKRPKSALESLLTALAVARMPLTRQLRLLRRAIPGASLADELLLYQSDEMERLADDQRTLKPDRLMSRLACLRAQPEIRDKALPAAKQWQRYLGQTEREAEQLQRELGAAPRPEKYPRLQALAVALSAEASQQASRDNDAVRQMRKLLPLAQLLAQTAARDHWAHFIEAAKRVAGELALPFSQTQQAEKDAERPHYLYQIGSSLELREQAGPHLLRFGEPPFCLESGRTLTQSIELHWGEVSLIGQSREYRLQRMAKPTWAQRIWRNHDGLFAAHADGAVLQLEEAGPERRQSRWRVIENPWPWADEIGVDEDDLLWAEFSIGEARQRMRWIPPGSFMMGSPKGEAGRDDNETQHSVTLTRGYWLAETSCTQSLWQAVMRKNSSHHKGDNLPVEQVSWKDCQSFIAKLGKLLPGLNPVLPTEAQWEYACRAGSKSAYWWGDDMDKRYANNGMRTEVEANYPANGFGLRSMSGNVYEWCADWLGDYPSEQVVDPRGPAEGHERVLRGGSWSYRGRDLRSAGRFARAPGGRFRYIGLRLAGGYDPQASREARPMSADRLERSGRRRGAQGAGDGTTTGAR